MPKPNVVDPHALQPRQGLAGRLVRPASVAQWKSSSVLRKRLGVRVPPGATRPRGINSAGSRMTTGISRTLPFLHVHVGGERARHRQPQRITLGAARRASLFVSRDAGRVAPRRGVATAFRYQFGSTSLPPLRPRGSASRSARQSSIVRWSRPVVRPVVVEEEEREPRRMHWERALRRQILGDLRGDPR